MDKEDRSQVSVEDVEEMIHPQNEAELVEAFGSLFTKSEPEPDIKVSPGAVTKPTPGSNSSESGQLLYTT